MTGTKKERKRASWLYISKEWFYALQQGDYTGKEVNVKGSSSFCSCSNLDIYFFVILFIYFWLCWVFFAVLRLSPVVVSGCYSLLIVLACGLLIAVASRCRAQAPGRAGFSSCDKQAQKLRHVGSSVQAQQLWRMGLVAPCLVGFSWTRDQTLHWEVDS